MPRVYIAGPMRGIPFLNFPAFDRARKLLTLQGWDVISPADIDRHHGVDEKDFPTGHEANTFTPAQIREVVVRDVNVFLHVLKAEEGDAIALLPLWVKSTGGKAEFALAQWLTLKVLNAETGGKLVAGVEGFEVRPHLSCEDGSCETPDRSSLERAYTLIGTAIANGK